MNKISPVSIQAKIFDFALTELVYQQRESFSPLWTVDSWVKFFIWMALNCGLSGDKEILEQFGEAMGSNLTRRIRKLFFERTIQGLSLHLMADPAEKYVLVMPLNLDFNMSNDVVQKALIQVGLDQMVEFDSTKWQSMDSIISIPWRSGDNDS